MHINFILKSSNLISLFIDTEFAWVTLATNDSYALGALVVANSLKKVNTVHQLAVLVTPGVTPSMKDKLRTVFNVVEEVNVLDSKDAANLALLSRPELGITFTKLHCWRLTQFEKCVFLDADTFVSSSYPYSFSATFWIRRTMLLCDPLHMLLLLWRDFVGLAKL